MACTHQKICWSYSLPVYLYHNVGVTSDEIASHFLAMMTTIGRRSSPYKEESAWDSTYDSTRQKIVYLLSSSQLTNVTQFHQIQQLRRGIKYRGRDQEQRPLNYYISKISCIKNSYMRLIYHKRLTTIEMFAIKITWIFPYNLIYCPNC